MADIKHLSLVEIGLRYKTAREARRLSQEQAADIGGTSQQNISKAELGEHFLASDVAYRLCEAYGINFEYLMSGRAPGADSITGDPRMKCLTEDQLSHYRAIKDHYFASLGIVQIEPNAGPGEDSR